MFLHKSLNIGRDYSDQKEVVQFNTRKQTYIVFIIRF